MLKTVKVILTQPGWTKVTESSTGNYQTWLKGNLFLGEQKIDVQTLHNYLRDKRKSNHALDSISFNGFYSWIYEENGKTYVSCDHIRSIPLFYSTNPRSMIADDPYLLTKQMQASVNSVAVQEFHLAGYVTGRETLFNEIFQVQAGEILLLHDNRSSVIGPSYKHFSFLPKGSGSRSADIKKKLYGVIDNIVRRTIEVFPTGLFVLPLSGGYDSRLLAIVFKKYCPDRLVAFTYGKKDNRESRFSKEVARKLDIPWHFVEYSEEKWKEFWDSIDRNRYVQFSTLASSTSHMQEILAVEELIQREVICEDDIIIPGHSGDFVAGNHIPEFCFCNDVISTGDLTNYIFEKHFTNVPLSYLRNTSKEFWLKRINSRFFPSADNQGILPNTVLENWDWQERQSKYICNSVRDYEYRNLKWWLPLWDREFATFWCDIPLDKRRNRYWYKTQVEDLYKKATRSHTLGNAEEKQIPLLRLLRTILRQITIVLGVKSLYDKYFRFRYSKDPLLFLSRYNKRTVRRYVRKGMSTIGVNSTMVFDSLAEEYENLKDFMLNQSK